MKRKFNHLRLLIDSLARAPQKKDRGYVMVVVLGIGIAMLGLLTTYVVVARTERMGVSASRDSSTGFSAAEAGLNLRAEALRQDFLGFNRPGGTTPTSSFCATSNTTATNDFRCINYRFPSDTPGQPDRVTTTYVSDLTQPDPNCTLTPASLCEPRMGRVPAGEQFQGLSMQQYTYLIYGIGRKATQLNASNQITENSPVEGIMEMQVKSRLIPMFQFAAFYANDLEITPGPKMLFEGPIHTNKNLMLAGWHTPAPGLQINGQITVARPSRIYNSVAEDNCGSDCSLRSRTNENNGVHIRNAANTDWINLLQAGTGATTKTSNPMARLENPATNVFGTQVQVGIQPVILPTFNGNNQQSFLSCNSGDTQDVCSRADINVTYNPPTIADVQAPTNLELAVIPFTVVAHNQTNSGTRTASRDLTTGELRSLRQPVLVTSENTGGGIIIPGTRGSVDATRTSLPVGGVCEAHTSSSEYNTLNNWLNDSARTAQKTLINSNRAQIQNALRVALVSQVRPIDFNQLNRNVLSNGTAITTTAPDPITEDLAQSIAFHFHKSLVDQVGNNTAIRITNALRRSTVTGSLQSGNAFPPLRAIAALEGIGKSCFVSAPFQEILRFYNDREGGRNIRMLQANIASMTIWNRDGRYITFNAAGNAVSSTNDGKGFTAADTTDAFSSVGGNRSLLYNLLDAEASAPATSFQKYGYAAADRSHGGMVVHFGMANGVTYTARQSPYAFTLIGGRQLFGRARYNNYDQNPAGVTFASPQAMYIQGDFNNYLEEANHATFEVDTANFNANSPNTLIWQPSSVLADTINVLSNRCRNTLFDRVVKTGSGQNCNAQGDDIPLDNTTGSRPGASPTTTRVAFLSGTDISNGPPDPNNPSLPTAGGFSGGIQNYPRYAEGWGNDNHHIYAGSFVSLGIPNEVSGRWDAQNGNYGPPRRIWAFESRFRDAANLPPLSPRFVTMQQEIFRRRFSR
jgi:Tfp pilus assembly protein PilX